MGAAGGEEAGVCLVKAADVGLRDTEEFQGHSGAVTWG